MLRGGDILVDGTLSVLYFQEDAISTTFIYADDRSASAVLGASGLKFPPSQPLIQCFMSPSQRSRLRNSPYRLSYEFSSGFVIQT